ncbi:hypothetical protein LQF61_02290 [Tetragenococcus koreensis]|uniref:hypothetical protein n=1 Tax=Tetragenococcus koreensis TaxID=290335 RepID=UPI001F401198|nr:hypothetical protein [Tetragenococcus koreensis]MCF1585295.1 hypothetical protein [Tetragenococcus koreensis]MCF1614898.1 hypothetical protein [Tetragenococcus koreensis]MCF1618905.1 hypothetical protein [Tetragenococcus koreensis]MCF1624707.1 hypothetical protein [Tetragenococcus koreensis]MCF1629578.1 hypothetical protein [Tetragenococcus koreensis]
MKKIVNSKRPQFNFDYIQQEIIDVLEHDPNIDEHLMFLATIKEMLRYEDDWARQSPKFIGDYYFPLEEVEEIRHCENFREPYEVYCELIRVYYLLTNQHGKKIFHKMLNWFPAKNKKYVFLNWPNDFALSLFYPEIVKSNIYFEDVKTKQKFHIVDRDDLLLTSIKETRSPFLSLLVPTDKKFITDMILPCENFDPISLDSADNLSKRNWESYLLHWYRENLRRSCLPS